MALPATKTIRTWTRAGKDFVDVKYILNEDGLTYSMATPSVLKQLEVILSLDTNQYADGDVLAATQEISNFFRTIGGTAFIWSIDILDEDKQAGPFDILFFKSNVDIGAENAAYAITDAEMREKIGRIIVLAADYTTWTEFSTAYKERGGTGFELAVLQAAVDSKSLWISAISRSTKTYSASGIRLLINYSQES